MAKKARQKTEEEEAAFEFPPFDEPAFVRHESEQFYATLLAFVIGVALGGGAFIVGRLDLPVLVPFGVGIAGVVGGVFSIRALRPGSSEYTKGDWASLIMLMFFGFLAIWFLLADLSPH